MKDIVITGLSAISALGHDPRADSRRLGKESCLDTMKDGRRYAPVRENWVELLGGRGWRHCMRCSLMACWAGRAAMADAGAQVGGSALPEDIGIVMATDYNSLFVPPFEEAVHLRDLALCNPALFLNLSTNAVPSQTAMHLGLHGFSLTLCSGPIAGLEALEAGAQALAQGRSRIVLAGGSQEMVPEVIDGLRTGYPAAHAEGLFSTGEQPGAIVAGEGCALLQLESMDFAQARKARVRARLRGYGQGVAAAAEETFEPAAGSPVEQAIREALGEAGLAPGDIGAIFLAANGHPDVDRAEAEAIARLFPQPVPAAGVKSCLGETLHAGGALATAYAIACLEQGFLPPTYGLLPSAWAERLAVSAAPRVCRPAHALILAMEHTYKAAALILEMPKGS